VSNLEQRPAETLTGTLAGAVPSPRHGLQVLAPREVPLGGTRAMHVRRTLPHRDLRTVGAWCFLDDYGPQDVSGTGAMQVPPHPHTGLQTVTWLLDGRVRHQDSLGNDLLVRPGELNLMTAGRGISHAETSPAGATGDVRGLQLWVALPSEHRDVVPDLGHHADLPVLHGDGFEATLLLGSLMGATSPARAFTPIVGAEISVRSGGAATVEIERAHEHAVLALSDDLVVDGTPVGRAHLVHLPPGRPALRLSAGHAAGRLLLLGGQPFGEELLMWWNFVARSHDEIVEAREEWTAAVSGAATRFGQVSAYDGPALPAPALPTSRLRPRRPT
jgi:redox-sensitive bicupin YhaK (pirin superfamily)